MPESAKRSARERAKRAQQRFEQAHGQVERAAKARREDFQRAAAAGLSMAEIGAAVGLHRSRVNQIIKGK